VTDELFMQPPQKTLPLSHNRLMEGYLRELKVAADLQMAAVVERRQTNASAVWQPLEDQIKRWWANLPPSLRGRRFQLVEIAAHCCNRSGGKPANRDIAAALRALGWREFRDWSLAGRNRRFWIRSEKMGLM
jgi:hypothetical protein